MINFFRRIRQALLAENKFNRYLLYAVGEIVLVMIGILLALQVNTWNEGRKAKKEEIRLPREFRKDVAFSVNELDTIAKYNARSVAHLKTIQRHLIEDLPYSKVLDNAFGGLDVWHMPYLPMTSYETIKVKGIDQISNDRLKTEITKVYEFALKYLLEDNGRWEWSFNQNTTQRMMIGHIRRDPDLDSEIARPNDYEALKQNTEFGNFISVLVVLRLSHTTALNEVKEDMQELLHLLDQELKPFSDD